MKNLQIADFRSDHCCQPPKQMLKVMSEAQTGVDIFSDDQVTNDLQLKISSMFGKQSALFFPSTEMANLAVVLAMCKLGQEVILEGDSRISRKQGPQLAMFAGVLTNNISGQKGMLDPVQVQKSIKSNKQMLVVAHTSMIIIQNPTSSGRVYPKKQLTKLSQISRKKQVHLHLDGSRIFHALAHYKFPPKEICDYYDTMTISFEKSLSCPGGAVVIGSQDVIKKIKIKKKALGGSMGQTGIITAGCLWALDNLLPEIQRDNEMARFLAGKLSQIPDILIQPQTVESNLVYFAFKGNFPHESYLKNLSENKIILRKYEDTEKYCLVIHRQIRQNQIVNFIEMTKSFIELFHNSQKSESISIQTSSRQSSDLDMTEQNQINQKNSKDYN